MARKSTQTRLAEALERLTAAQEGVADALERIPAMAPPPPAPENCLVEQIRALPALHDLIDMISLPAGER
jgi:hypothetical protein